MLFLNDSFLKSDKKKSLESLDIDEIDTINNTSKRRSKNGQFHDAIK